MKDSSNSDSDEEDNSVLPANFISVSRQTVDSISLGECHMVVRCTKTIEEDNYIKMVYVMGNNQWGQLGIDPFEDERSSFIPKLRPLDIQHIQDKKYEVKEVACGSNHTLMLLESLEDQKLIEFGNPYSNQTDQFMLNMINLESANLYTIKDKFKHEPQIKAITEMSHGKVIVLTQRDDKMNIRYSGQKTRTLERIKFIRASYGRSCAIKNSG